jgi:hypothetical protein
MSRVDPIYFTARVRHWNPEKGSGLSVADVPADLVAAFGGLRQQRVHGSLAGTAFTSNVMPAGDGRLALSVSGAMMKAASVAVGETAEVEIVAIGRE